MGCPRVPFCSARNPGDGSNSFHVGRGRSAMMALSGICSRVGGGAGSRFGSGGTGACSGMGVFSRTNGGFFLAILARVFDGRVDASGGIGDGFPRLSFEEGRRETAMDSCGNGRVEGFGHRNNARTWMARDRAKKREKRPFTEATQIVYCTRMAGANQRLQMKGSPYYSLITFLKERTCSVSVWVSCLRFLSLSWCCSTAGCRT